MTDLQAALGGLKGPLMKVAQILATVPDLLPEEYVQELRKLQTSAPPMGWSFVRRRMATELGGDWQGRFASFDREASAAASLGQVHKAVSHDGRDLACKIQYPDMASAVEADLKQLKAVFAIYRRYDKAIDPTQIHLELSERLREELDYRREASNMALYRALLADETGVHVPEVLDDLSTDRLLTMTWLSGAPLMDSVAVLPYAAIGAVHADPVDPMPVIEDQALLSELPAEAVDALLAVAGPGSGSPQVIVELRMLGGAFARPAAHRSATSSSTAMPLPTAA